MLQVTLDVETQKTFDEVGGYFPEKLGVSFVGACIRDSGGQGEMRSFFEKDLPLLFEVIEQADLLIGFNIIGFDLPVLSHYFSGDTNQLPVLDLLARIKDSAGHRISLDAVAKETLGTGKTGDGLDAIKYYKTQNWAALEKYCLQDVVVTRDLYDFGLRNGKVKFRNKWNRLIECPVDFTFKTSQSPGIQMPLL